MKDDLAKLIDRIDAARLSRRGFMGGAAAIGALATMGAGLPSAMMSAMLYPDRKVMAICGDGGFMMNSQEMETAVRLGLNMTVLILRDDAYGMIRWKQANMGFNDFGLTYGNPDFVKYVESYGGIGHRVESSEHLTEVLLVDDITTATPIAGVDQIELNIRTSRPLTAAERENLVRRTEERLSAQDS